MKKFLEDHHKELLGELKKLYSTYRQQLRNKLNTKATERLIEEQQRRIWVLFGHFKKGHSKAILEEIAERYKKLDLVPNHYRHADLWGFTEKPKFERQLDDMFAR